MASLASSIIPPSEFHHYPVSPALEESRKSFLDTINNLSERMQKAQTLLRMMQICCRHSDEVSPIDMNDFATLVDELLAILSPATGVEFGDLENVHIVAYHDAKIAAYRASGLRAIAEAAIKAARGDCTLASLRASAKSVFDVAQRQPDLAEYWDQLTEAIESRGLTVSIEHWGETIIGPRIDDAESARLDRGISRAAAGTRAAAQKAIEYSERRLTA